MTSRQAGRREAAISKARRSAAKGRGVRRTTHRKDEPLPPKERRQLLHLVICGSVFVLLVAAKLLLPDQMSRVNAKLSAAMERNMDVQAVFSAVGRVFSGESEVDSAADEVYQAVFHGEAGETLKTSVQVPATQEAAALETLREYRAASTEEADAGETSDAPSGDADAGSPAEPMEAETLAYVLYSEQNLPEGVSLEQAILGFDYYTPVSGTVSSDFGYRDHPVEGEERFHYGVDLAADTGTEVCCFADGTVTAVGESSSYGKYCIVSHEGGYSTLYAHCSRVTASSGAAVRGGEKIAEVGESGMATGPHLHFELQRDGDYLNPIYYVSGI